MHVQYSRGTQLLDILWKIAISHIRIQYSCLYYVLYFFQTQPHGRRLRNNKLTTWNMERIQTHKHSMSLVHSTLIIGVPWNDDAYVIVYVPGCCVALTSGSWHSDVRRSVGIFPHTLPSTRTRTKCAHTHTKLDKVIPTVILLSFRFRLTCPMIIANIAKVYCVYHIMYGFCGFIGRKVIVILFITKLYEWCRSFAGQTQSKRFGRLACGLLAIFSSIQFQIPYYMLYLFP